jgi:hypothetical protein
VVGSVIARRLIVGGTATFPGPVATREALYNGTDSDGPYAIGAATFDGSTWTVHGSNPVLQKGSGGAWDDDHVKDPCLLHDGMQYVVYYSGYDGSAYRIGRATASALTGPWTKYASNPVLDLGSGGAFDDAGVIFPTVHFDGTTWRMWYGGYDGSTHRIGYASSADGVTWTKHGQVVDLGSSGAWNDEGTVPAAIYKDGPTYHLFTGGRQGTTVPRWQGGVYTFTDPEGTYTPTAGNPTLLARFNDSGTSQALTANANAGDDTIEVASTAAFNVNEPVALADIDSGTHISSIESIDSGTQVTLIVPPGENMTTAQSATIRPLAYNSVQPRSVLPAVLGGYEMFFTPFQPVDDLSVAEPKLREGAMRATSSTLDGEWTYDYATGLMFPLHDGGWDNLSAENPSVIVTP